MKKLTALLLSITCLLLAGCTEVTIDDIKKMEETKEYVKELKTDENGRVIIDEEKPSVDLNEPAETQPLGNMIYSDKEFTFVEMNQTYTIGKTEYEVKEAIAFDTRHGGYKLVEEKYLDAIRNELEPIRNTFDENGKVVNQNRRVLWVKVRLKNNLDRKVEERMYSGIVSCEKKGIYKRVGSVKAIDKEAWYTGESNQGNTVMLDANEEKEVWMVFIILYEEGREYYMRGSFGFIDDPNFYKGYLIKLNIQDGDE